MKCPTITALMITKNRLPFVADSYRDFQQQTYPAKKLLIVTDGDEKEHTYLKAMARKDKNLTIIHLNGAARTLGELRNIAIEQASSDLSIQWDDDDRYGPTRMTEQWEGLQGQQAALLTEQLHYFKDTAEVAWVVDPTGIEGTLLLDRRCGLRYPRHRRGEDTVLKRALRDHDRLQLVQGGVCYCRVYHGGNTWDHAHHVERVKKLGKTKAQLDLQQLAKVAISYEWKPTWKPIYGT